MGNNATTFRRERGIMLAALLGMTVAAWFVTARQASTAGTSDMSTGLTMGMDAVLFVTVWLVMMVAMMFPSAAPMILTFAAVYRGRQQRGQAFVPTWIFVAGYVLVWALFGVLAYALAVGAERLAGASPGVMANAGRLGGVLILAAGVYQLSPLKSVCLSKCRTPTQFVLSAWRNGPGGALRMGLEHGLVCVGCCWLLYLILFPLGIMNLAVMALLTALIFAEKVLPGGRRVARGAAIALIAYGALVVFVPAALPGMSMGM